MLSEFMVLEKPLVKNENTSQRLISGCIVQLNQRISLLEYTSYAET